MGTLAQRDTAHALTVEIQRQGRIVDHFMESGVKDLPLTKQKLNEVMVSSAETVQTLRSAPESMVDYDRVIQSYQFVSRMQQTWLRIVYLTLDPDEREAILSVENGGAAVLQEARQQVFSKHASTPRLEEMTVRLAVIDVITERYSLDEDEGAEEVLDEIGRLTGAWVIPVKHKEVHDSAMLMIAGMLEYLISGDETINPFAQGWYAYQFQLGVSLAQSLVDD